MRGFRCLSVLAALQFAACSGVADLDDSAAASLSPAETAAVRQQIEKALSDDEKEWAAAWNQEVKIGAARERLERVALAALADESGDAEDMFEALRKKWGGLTPAARAQVDDAVATAIAEKDWDRAVELEILSADAADRPAFKGAWAIYRQSPADEAVDLFESIEDARKDLAKETEDK